MKLLRALQEGEIDPVGAKKPVKVDFRLISATNRDMIQLVKEGKFREDLYYRLNVFPIWVPPLRERLEDVPELALHFLARFAAEEGRRVNGFRKRPASCSPSYTWPGNVRQLENAVFRAVVLADGPELTVAEFPQIAAHCEGFSRSHPGRPGSGFAAQRRSSPARDDRRREPPSRRPSRSVTPPGGLARHLGRQRLRRVRALEEVEADMIRLALGRYRGHMTEVAKRLEDRPLDTLPQDAGIRPRAAHELSFQRPARKRAFRLSVPFRTLEMLSARCSATTRHRDQTDLLPSRFTTFLIRLGFPVTTH